MITDAILERRLDQLPDLFLVRPLAAEDNVAARQHCSHFGKAATFEDRLQFVLLDHAVATNIDPPQQRHVPD